MKKASDLMLEIIEGRKKAKKRIKEEVVRKATIADYAYDILKAFEISNREEQSTILLWQLKLYGIKFDYLSIMMSFEKGKNAKFYNPTYLEHEYCKKNLLGNNEMLEEYIQNLKISSEAFVDLCQYFKEKFSENLNIEVKDEALIIELRDGIICEK